MRAPSVRSSANAWSCSSMKEKNAWTTPRTRSRAGAAGWATHESMRAVSSWPRARSIVAASRPSFDPK